MRVWITKYALTSGIQEAEARVSNTSEKMIVAESGNGRGVGKCYRKPHWHKTFQDANERAGEMRTQKIASLRKQIAKLESLSFA